jgi:hypothetical protein
LDSHAITLNHETGHLVSRIKQSAKQTSRRKCRVLRPELSSLKWVTASG